MNWRRLRSSMGSSPEPAVPAYRRLTMPRKHPQVLGADLNRSDLRRRAMRFGVRTGKPPGSGESAAADLEEQWNLRALKSLLAADESRVSQHNTAGYFLGERRSRGAWTVPPVSLRTNARVISSMRLRTKRRAAARRPWH